MRIDISHITLPENFNDITDFYLPKDNPMLGILYPNAQELNHLPEFSDIVSLMISEAEKSPKIEFSLELVHNGMRIILRGHSIKSVEGKIFIFRRLPSYIPQIHDIGMPKNIIELLLSERLNHGGLIIIAGETGQGKSTTAAATIAYRLSHFGSFCLTIEDPVELPLQGFYINEKDPTKQGVCFQTNVEGEEVAAAIKSSLRCYPSISNSILFLGETRDPMMASEVLRIAANGHLVITTMHGSDLQTSLKRFVGLAKAYNENNQDEVNSLFSSVFRLMIHQRIETLTNGKKRLRPQVLFSYDQTSPIASRLNENKIDMLSTEIQNQNMMLAKNLSLLNKK